MNPQASVLLAWALLASAFLAAPARAFDMTGVWASDASLCDKVFATKGGRTSFRKNSDSFGSGFIITGRRITGKTTSCNITSTRNEGANVHLIASCSDDVALSTMQFSVRALDDNSMARFFAGVPELETRYYRCKAK
ncbi:MAG: hypothetical protein JWN93_2423 [Hyphomicrobiales bacterium]|nr:hypothetical protein [Hyphomicrobiales bacterium]